MASINAIQQQLNIPTTPNVLPGKADEASGSFGKFLLEGIQEVNQMQQDADRAVESLFTGGDVNPAEVLTAVQKADMSFKLMMQVRNKMMQAYAEVKDIRV
ncbi:MULTISPECIES: flagellar hook-basal body complex protein FliE [Bremerella]|uniref:flagellar hook-basal body complex protein FliE n=1 Tax=Bremerella TaxID=2714594 RepID=UPI0031F0BD71